MRSTKRLAIAQFKIPHNELKRYWDRTIWIPVRMLELKFFNRQSYPRKDIIFLITCLVIKRCPSFQSSSSIPKIVKTQYRSLTAMIILDRAKHRSLLNVTSLLQYENREFRQGPEVIFLQPPFNSSSGEFEILWQLQRWKRRMKRREALVTVHHVSSDYCQSHFSFMAKCWRGGRVGGQFYRNLNWSKLRLENCNIFTALWQMESTSSWTSTKNYQSLQSLLHISGKTT